MKQDFRNSIKLVKQHYFFTLFGLKPSKTYKGLDKESLSACESVIEKFRTEIWNKDFWGLSVKDSIAAVAGPIEADLNVIKKLKKDLADSK
jgi:hypothetical protein